VAGAKVLPIVKTSFLQKLDRASGFSDLFLYRLSYREFLLQRGNQRFHSTGLMEENNLKNYVIVRLESGKRRVEGIWEKGHEDL